MAPRSLKILIYAAGNLNSANNGGSGWNSGWGAGTGATSTMRVKSSNLTYSSATGYNIAQSGTGLASGVYHVEFRGINRNFDTAMSGAVWFSVLLANNSAVERSGIQFNNPRTGGLDYNPSSFAVALNGSSLDVSWGTTTSVINDLAIGSTHLLLGRIDVASGNDTLQLWVDSTDLTNPGTPIYTSSAADLGDTLFRAGIFAYAVTGAAGDYGRVDALRISDGNGDTNAAYFAVTGADLVPEPQRALLCALAFCPLLIRRRR